MHHARHSWKLRSSSADGRTYDSGFESGFSLFTNYAHVTYPFLAGFVLAQFAFTIVGLIGAKQFAAGG